MVAYTLNCSYPGCDQVALLLGEHIPETNFFMVKFVNLDLLPSSIADSKHHIESLIHFVDDSMYTPS